ncbi:histidine kinase [Pseudomonas entomophila]|uniref:histidine kinase n=1 Tax=Pseudomonas entomophila TaxID=312306 RepID=UPI0015E4474E|nr:histidine kinase [Pseudomonas entomophila]MBA1189918.1 histidine kinase [Pseudomonas entomophila]
MDRLSVLIHQHSPFHQIHLHQALNAQGVFDVRVTDDLALACAWLERHRPLDLLVVDHGLRLTEGQPLIEQLACTQGAHAVLFVGHPRGGEDNLARQAQALGLWVLGELDWPLSTRTLAQHLHTLRRSHPHARWQCQQTVMATSYAR